VQGNVNIIAENLANEVGLTDNDLINGVTVFGHAVGVTMNGIR
jgi:hypothetical protein